MSNELEIKRLNGEFRIENQDFDFDDFIELSELTEELEIEMKELDFLDEEKEKIQNPDALGEVIFNEVWDQFSNQIGLDITKESLVEEYDRKHPEPYSEVAGSVMKDSRYINKNKEMKEKQQNGELIDGYTGKNLGRNDTANLDHVVSRKEIFENLRRKQAGISTEELANMDENLVPTNEAFNKSKGAKSADEYYKNFEERKRKLIEQNEKQNKKIDKLNVSEAEKRQLKEKNKKSLEDKLSADEKRVREAEKRAKKAQNKKILPKATKKIALKSVTNALKAGAVSALFALLKEIMKGLIKFFKAKKKSVEIFIEEMKNSLERFFEKIKDIFKIASSTFVGTLLSEVFGPIVGMIKRLSNLLKQGVQAVWDAIKYLKDPLNKNRPFSEKALQVGKIIMAGMTVGVGVVLGEVFENLLMGVPGMQIPIPLMGTLANIIGLFLGSVVSGVIGAISINWIDKFLANIKRKEIDKEKNIQQNKVLELQNKVSYALDKNNEINKKRVASNIVNRHKEKDLLFENYQNTQIENSKARSENSKARSENSKARKESIERLKEKLNKIK